MFSAGYFLYATYHPVMKNRKLTNLPQFAIKKRLSKHIGIVMMAITARSSINVNLFCRMISPPCPIMD